MTAIEEALLTVDDALLLLEDAIALVELALNDSPAPGERIDLLVSLADLDLARVEWTERRIVIKNGTVAFPPPGDDVLESIAALTEQVEEARQAGISAQARLAVANQVFALGFTLMGL